MKLGRNTGGAVAGAVAAALWAAQQGLDKRLFDSRYDDLELLGKAVTSGPAWPVIGIALHVQNGAIFGAAYAQLKSLLPGPAIAKGVTAATLENVVLWPLTALADRYHPARDELPRLFGSRRTFAQATWRHVLFGAVLGALEQRLSRGRESEPREVPVWSNGHGNIEAAVGLA